MSAGSWVSWRHCPAKRVSARPRILVPGRSGQIHSRPHRRRSRSVGAVRGWLEAGGSGTIFRLERPGSIPADERFGSGRRTPRRVQLFRSVPYRGWGERQELPSARSAGIRGIRTADSPRRGKRPTHGPERHHIGTAPLTLEHFGCRQHCRACCREALKATQLPCGHARPAVAMQEYLERMFKLVPASIWMRTARQSG